MPRVARQLLLNSHLSNPRGLSGGRPRRRQEDLAHVLLRWQDAGIRILAVGPGDTQPRPFTAKKPSWFRRVWYRAIVVAGLRRNNAGGFGGVIPKASGGGYG